MRVWSETTATNDREYTFALEVARRLSPDALVRIYHELDGDKSTVGLLMRSAAQIGFMRGKDFEVQQIVRAE